LPDLALMGPAADPYTAVERRQRITRRALEVLAKHNYPLLLMTRSTMVLRDIDILREIHLTAQATVAVPLGDGRSEENGNVASSDQRRLLDRIVRSGIQTGALIRMHSGLSDRRLERLFRSGSDLGLDFIAFQRPWFDGNNPSPRASNFEPRFRLLDLAARYQLPLRMKRFIPKDYRRENYWLAGRLADSALIRWCSGEPFRLHLRAARLINNLRRDVRNILREGEVHRIEGIDTAVWPEIDRLLSGDWTPRMIWEG